MSPFDPELLARALMPREWMQRAEQLHLSLHLQPHQVSVALWESRCVWRESFTLPASSSDDCAEAVRFVKERNWTEKIFRRVTISFDTPYCTLVPQSFEIPGKQAELLWFNMPRPDEMVATCPLDELGATAVYATDSSLKPLIVIWPHARVFPSLMPLIRQALLPKEASTGIHVYLTEGRLWLVVVVNGKLALANHFSAQGSEDVLYHIANACMQHTLGLTTVAVWLYGDLSDELLPMLERYCSEAGLSSIDFPLSLHTLCA
jgi:hypothetical protein